MNSQISELYGVSTLAASVAELQEAAANEVCSFIPGRCKKSRKSTPELTIGTCSVRPKRAKSPVIVCPYRFISDSQIFHDLIPLLSDHSPGNDLHIIPEFQIPGGNVDYILASVQGESVVDFIGVELQAVDTTGTLWPSRQRLLENREQRDSIDAQLPDGSFGLNWKMTAKTILIQLHHKLSTFESAGKKLVLILQSPLMGYMEENFSFGHMSSPAKPEDSLHFYPYDLVESAQRTFSLALSRTRGTNDAGMLTALGLNSDSRIDIAVLSASMRAKISDRSKLKHDRSLDD